VHLLCYQIEEVDAVVSTIGGTPADPSADSEGNINLIKSAIQKGVKRFVLVTSIGTGDSRDAPPQQVYDVLEKVLLEKSKAEDYLKVWPEVSLLQSAAMQQIHEHTGNRVHVLLEGLISLGLFCKSNMKAVQKNQHNKCTAESASLCTCQHQAIVRCSWHLGVTLHFLCARIAGPCRWHGVHHHPARGSKVGTGHGAGRADGGYQRVRRSAPRGRGAACGAGALQ
jgi:NAD(P)H-binding